MVVLGKPKIKNMKTILFLFIYLVIGDLPDFNFDINFHLEDIKENEIS